MKYILLLLLLVACVSAPQEKVITFEPGESLTEIKQLDLEHQPQVVPSKGGTLAHEGMAAAEIRLKPNDCQRCRCVWVPTRHGPGTHCRCQLAPECEVITPKEY